MKALFINKPFFIEPLGMMYLSSSAKKSGHDVDLVLTTEDLEKKVSEYRPDVIGYSIMTGDQDFYMNINNELKKKFNFTSIFGGPHPTFFSDMIEEEGVDIVCKGEGEDAFRELLDRLESGQPIDYISNLFVKNNGEVKKNMVSPFSDIDSLEFPDRDLVFKFPEIKSGPIKHFLASRGCPFSCSYCFNESYSEIYGGKGKRVRFRDPKLVVDEVEQVINSSPTKFVYFQDDTFTLNKSWLKDFSEEYSKRIDMPFHCHVRPNTLDEERVTLLKKAGCYSTHIAAETADDRLRNEVLKRNMSKEQIINSSKLLKDYGIKFMLQNIIGIPTGSLENDIETLELNIKCNPDYAWVSIFQPYPGTELGKFSIEKGFFSGDFNDIGSNFFDSSKLDFPEEYKNQISNLQKLFAIFVEYPELHSLELSGAMIDTCDSKTKEMIQSGLFLYLWALLKANQKFALTKKDGFAPATWDSWTGRDF